MELSAGSRVAIFATAFPCRLSFSVALWTIWQHLSSFGSSFVFFVIVLCAYAAGEMVGTMKFRVFTRRFTVRRSMLMINTLKIVGASLYVIAPLLGDDWKSRTSVLVGRGVLGLWAGSGQSIQEAYLEKIFTPSLLTPVAETLSAYESLGFVVGLVLGLSLFSLPRIGALGLSVNETPLPGVFILLFLFVCFALCAMVFNEEAERSAIAVINSSTQGQAALQEEVVPLVENSANTATMVSFPRFVKQARGLIILFLYISFMFALRKVTHSSSGEKSLAWSDTPLSSFIFGASFAGLLTFEGARYLFKTDMSRFWTVMVPSCSFGFQTFWSLFSAPVTMDAAQVLIAFNVISVAFLSVRLVAHFIDSITPKPCDQGMAQRIMYAFSVFWWSTSALIDAGVIYSTFDQAYPFLEAVAVMVLIVCTYRI